MKTILPGVPPRQGGQSDEKLLRNFAPGPAAG
jgi:hypothetical protein